MMLAKEIAMFYVLGFLFVLMLYACGIAAFGFKFLVWTLAGLALGGLFRSARA
jgi:hypothetical protein